MKVDKIKVNWPNGICSISSVGKCWLEEGSRVGISIPTGCLNGSCGACEIDVNGTTVRACISEIEEDNLGYLDVEFTSDPYW